MRNRRLVVLTGVLAALNLALWLAPPGLALRTSVVHRLLGPKLVRAEVILRNGQDWRLDRGVMTDVTSSQVTLSEVDGRVQAIPLAATTRVLHLGRRFPLSVLATGWHVLVLWPSSGPAASVDVERVPKGQGAHARGLGPSPMPALTLRRAIVQQLFGPKLVRAEVILRNGQDWRLDRGVITDVTSSQVTLSEADGRVQAIPLAGTTGVLHLGRRFPLSVLATGWHVLVLWPSSGPAASVDVERVPKGQAPHGQGRKGSPPPRLS